MNTHPDSGLIFLFQMLVSLIVLSVIWIWFAAPYLKKRPAQEQLSWLTIPLLFQFIELTTFVNSVVHEMPIAFAQVGAINLITVPLAIALLWALRKDSRAVLPLAWILTLEGFVCGLATGYVGYVKNIVDHLGPHWYVGIIYLPIQIMSHLFILYTLLTRGRELHSSARPPDRPL